MKGKIVTAVVVAGMAAMGYQEIQARDEKIASMEAGMLRWHGDTAALEALRAELAREKAKTRTDTRTVPSAALAIEATPSQPAAKEPRPAAVAVELPQDGENYHELIYQAALRSAKNAEVYGQDGAFTQSVKLFVLLKKLGDESYARKAAEELGKLSVREAQFLSDKGAVAEALWNLEAAHQSDPGNRDVHAAIDSLSDNAFEQALSMESQNHLYSAVKCLEAVSGVYGKVKGESYHRDEELRERLDKLYANPAFYAQTEKIADQMFEKMGADWHVYPTYFWDYTRVYSQKKRTGVEVTPELRQRYLASLSNMVRQRRFIGLHEQASEYLAKAAVDFPEIRDEIQKIAESGTGE